MSDAHSNNLSDENNEHNIEIKAEVVESEHFNNEMSDATPSSLSAECNDVKNISLITKDAILEPAVTKIGFHREMIDAYSSNLVNENLIFINEEIDCKIEHSDNEMLDDPLAENGDGKHISLMTEDVTLTKTNNKLKEMTRAYSSNSMRESNERESLVLIKEEFDYNSEHDDEMSDGALFVENNTTPITPITEDLTSESSIINMLTKVIHANDGKDRMVGFSRTNPGRAEIALEGMKVILKQKKKIKTLQQQCNRYRAKLKYFYDLVQQLKKEKKEEK